MVLKSTLKMSMNVILIPIKYLKGGKDNFPFLLFPQKEGWAPKNCCFPIVVLEKTLGLGESLGLQGDQTSQS